MPNGNTRIVQEPVTILCFIKKKKKKKRPQVVIKGCLGTSGIGFFFLAYKAIPCSSESIRSFVCIYIYIYISRHEEFTLC